MKRILRDAVGTGRKLNGEKAAMALLEYRNTPIRDLERSPAQMLFGRHMRDLMQIRDMLDQGQYQIQEHFQLSAEDRERAFFEKIQREGIKWSMHTRHLEKLGVGQDVVLQSMRGNDKGKWTSTGKVLVADPQN